MLRPLVLGVFFGATLAGAQSPAPKDPTRLAVDDQYVLGPDSQPQAGVPTANKALAAALKEKGYDHQFVFGEGTHNAKHGASILPHVLRWL